jgi:hypothetical protein
MLMKSLSIVAAIPACFLVYYGAVMLFMVPGYPGEPYFAAGRVIYGCVPMTLGVGLFLLARWFWKRGRSGR